MVTQHRDGGQRRQAGCRAARWQLRPTGVPWRCLRGGAVEVAPPWSAVASAPPPAATAPCTLEGQHTNRERRRRAGEGAPGLPLPSTGGAWRCLHSGAVRVAPPLPVGATPAPFGLRRCSCCRCCCWRVGTPTGNGGGGRVRGRQAKIDMLKTQNRHAQKPSVQTKRQRPQSI